MSGPPGGDMARLEALNAALARQRALPIVSIEEAQRLTDDEVAVACELTFHRLQRIVALTT